MVESQRDRVRAELEPELRPVFDQLADEYKFQCLKFYGRQFVSYQILGALVKEGGWRPIELYKQIEDGEVKK